MRNAIRKDLVQFAVPGLTVFAAGLVVCGTYGQYDGLTPVLWKLVTQPGTLATLSGRQCVGLAMFVGGLAFAIVAVCTLKRFYCSTLVIREDHQLVTHGLYRFTRHPIYFGVLVVCLSVPVYAGSWLGLAVMLLLVPIFLNRIRLEEQMLTEEFGDAYRTYREKTSKLIPRRRRRD